LWGRGSVWVLWGRLWVPLTAPPPPAGPPERFHAAAVALCPAVGEGLALGALVAAARLGTHVRKTLLLCAAPPGGPPRYTSLTWRADL
ncbi:SEN34 endonuclease, partial [Atlantisia rogersi]|nr:SEN34 endonuclease [Atlantisia rogersi]